jgi:hypothetical protein
MTRQLLQEMMDAKGFDALYARTSYLLRESRKEILRRYKVENEIALLDKIRQGAVAEHPGYEHYLSALILEQMRSQIRAELLGLEEGRTETLPTMSVHLLFKEKLEQHYANRMSEAPRLAQDALILSFDTGLLMEVRYYSHDEYSIEWCWNEVQLRIDTAPVHVNQVNFRDHLHGVNDALRTYAAAQAGTDCWENFSSLLEILLKNPLLEDK